MSSREHAEFAENVKKPMEAGMLCMIDGTTFHSFMKNMWIGDSGASCHNTNNYKSLHDVMNINKLVQGSSGNMSTTKKNKLQMKCIKLMVSESYMYYGP